MQVCVISSSADQGGSQQHERRRESKLSFDISRWRK
jgi:hypothetical protein